MRFTNKQKLAYTSNSDIVLYGLSAGCGKTALLQEWCSRVKDCKTLVLTHPSQIPPRGDFDIIFYDNLQNLKQDDFDYLVSISGKLVCTLTSPNDANHWLKDILTPYLVNGYPSKDCCGKSTLYRGKSLSVISSNIYENEHVMKIKRYHDTILSCNDVDRLLLGRFV